MKGKILSTAVAVFRDERVKEMTTLVLIYSHIINQAKTDKGRCGNVPSR